MQKLLSALLGAQGKSYRYYVSAPLQQGRANPGRDDVRRISAGRLEALLADVVRRLSSSEHAHPLQSILRVEIQRRFLSVSLAVAKFPAIEGRLEEGERVERDADNRSRWRLTIPTFQHRSQTIIAATSKDTVRHDKVMIKALRSAHVMLDSDALGLPILDAAPDTPHQRRLLRAAFLAPDLQRMILAGRQHPSLNLERLTRGDIPICWIEQRDIFAV